MGSNDTAWYYLADGVTRDRNRPANAHVYGEVDPIEASTGDDPLQT
jgi:hypothetical protein